VADLHGVSGLQLVRMHRRKRGHGSLQHSQASLVVQAAPASVRVKRVRVGQMESKKAGAGGRAGARQCRRACEKKVVAMSSSLPPTHGLPSERHSPSGALRSRHAALALLWHACTSLGRCRSETSSLGMLAAQDTQN